MDVTGKTVYIKTITETGNLKPELENGIYMVKVKLHDGTIDVHRLVISK
ncbi:MAG: T9SS type A sorting domain-containing protein [Sphingobacteriaceae bacterium]|nr:T9SS type A sorting domain-containing protein [Sphingobacteriaceae bacterium]